MLDTRDEKCHAIIHGAATAAGIAGAGLAQLPLADTIPITAIQVGMIISLGKIFDVSLDESAAKALLGGFATSAAGRQVASFLVGWIPGIGNVFKAGTAGALTEAIGWAAVVHFENLENERENHFKHGVSAAEKEIKEKMKKIINTFKENDYFLMSVFLTLYNLTNNIQSNLTILQELFISPEMLERLKKEFNNITEENAFIELKKYLVKLNKEALSKIKELTEEPEKLNIKINKDMKKNIINVIDTIEKLDIIVSWEDSKREEKILTLLGIISL